MSTTTSAEGQVIQDNEKLTAGTMTDKYEDAALISLLRGDKAMQDEALLFIMSDTRRNILQYLYNRGCKDERAEGFFLEGLTNALMSIKSGQYQGKGSLEGYLKKICYNVWLSALRSEQASKAREKKVGHTMTTADLTADDLLFYEQRAILLKEFLQKIGAGCSKIMLLKAEGYSAKEIVTMTDYASESAVNKRNSICLKKVRILMRDNPHIMKLLKELHEK